MAESQVNGGWDAPEEKPSFDITARDREFFGVEDLEYSVGEKNFLRECVRDVFLKEIRKLVRMDCDQFQRYVEVSPYAQEFIQDFLYYHRKITLKKLYILLENTAICTPDILEGILRQRTLDKAIFLQVICHDEMLEEILLYQIETNKLLPEELNWILDEERWQSHIIYFTTASCAYLERGTYLRLKHSQYFGRNMMDCILQNPLVSPDVLVSLSKWEEITEDDLILIRDHGMATPSVQSRIAKVLKKNAKKRVP